MRDHLHFVYMVASARYGTLCVGVTNDLERRIQEHRDGSISEFAKKYGVKKLVWLERHGDIATAVARDKRLKRWRREWKIGLIEEYNPRRDEKMLR